jgi:hypothetical protein
MSICLLITPKIDPSTIKYIAPITNISEAVQNPAVQTFTYQDVTNHKFLTAFQNMQNQYEGLFLNAIIYQEKQNILDKMKESLEVLKGETVESILSPITTNISKGRPSKKVKRDPVLIEHLNKIQTDKIKANNKTFTAAKRNREDLHSGTKSIKRIKKEAPINNEDKLDFTKGTYLFMH